jgi:hypothetical protein
VGYSISKRRPPSANGERSGPRMLVEQPRSAPLMLVEQPRSGPRMLVE